LGRTMFRVNGDFVEEPQKKKVVVT